MSSQELNKVDNQIQLLKLDLENNPDLTASEITKLKKKIQKLQNQINSTLNYGH